MEIIPDKRKLVGLVEHAYEGKLCLPNFQRDFVWPREGVADLLRSLLRRYFIGSLLLLRCDPQNPPFDPVVLRGAKPLFAKPRPEHLVLDGQQRLTSLLYALTAPELSLKDSKQARRFFIDLRMLTMDPDNDEIVFDRTKKELDGLDKIEVQYAQRILPCTHLMRSKEFMAWRDGLDDWVRDNFPQEHKGFRVERDQWTAHITDLQAFEIPLVELPRVSDDDPAAIGRVCAIFEKLNSTGVELSVYDLLTARLYRSGIRLHDLWRSACQENPKLNEWSGGKADHQKFGVLLLRTLALLRGLDPKPRFLINLDPANFESDWRRAARAMERALELLTLAGNDGFGVFAKKWIPGFGLLPVLAALRAVIDENKLGDTERASLRRWYWCNVFLERYSSAVESKSRKDYVEMTEFWLQSKGPPSVFNEAQTRIGAAGFTVRESASHASAVYSGVFCLLAAHGARDWRRGETILLQDLEDHHIFPKAYLRRHGIQDKTVVNSIVNRTLISDETNAKIKDRAPAVYVADVAILPSGPEPELMGPHFVSESAIRAMRAATEGISQAAASEAYDSFRAAREREIVSRIRGACGVSDNSESPP